MTGRRGAPPRGPPPPSGAPGDGVSARMGGLTVRDATKMLRNLASSRAPPRGPPTSRFSKLGGGADVPRGPPPRGPPTVRSHRSARDRVRALMSSRITSSSAAPSAVVSGETNATTAPNQNAQMTATSPTTTAVQQPGDGSRMDTTPTVVVEGDSSDDEVDSVTSAPPPPSEDNVKYEDTFVAPSLRTSRCAKSRTLPFLYVLLLG